MTRREEYEYDKLVSRASHQGLTEAQEKRMNELGKKRIEEKIAERKEWEEITGKNKPKSYNYEWDYKKRLEDSFGGSK